MEFSIIYHSAHNVAGVYHVASGHKKTGEHYPVAMLSRIGV